MDFKFTEEQLMIRDTAEAFLAEFSGSAAVREQMAAQPAAYDAELWRRICTDMYWQAIHVPEQYGGLGLGYVELLAVLEPMGRHLLCSPFFATVCLAANALLVAADDRQKAEFLAQIAAGTTATLAWTGARGQWSVAGVEGVWSRSGEDFVLNGQWRFVPDGHSAQLLVIAAREAGSDGEDGISLFVLPADAPGLGREWLPAMDQTRPQARLSCRDVVVPARGLLGEAGRAAPLLGKTLDLASIALAAEQVGGAQRVLDMSVEYSRERVQFGRSIASFQAIKHKAADLLLKVESARSAASYAACIAGRALLGDAGDAELREAASVAKAWCSDAYFLTAGSAIQIHGGIGVTWEYDLQLYFKRSRSSEVLLGNGAQHRERIAAMLLD
ncbi:MAG: acyl-CoA/acyl-ACP dehydrogenase [Halieaceae bacterium]|nr:acyl-CoA/acyl-ACP dehydrogenase [Halieaceae bacterium]